MHLRRILSQAALVLGAILFSAGLQTYAASFAQPTQSAPNGDAVAPLDTGSNLNTKAGNLSINPTGLFATGLAVGGNVVVAGNVQAPQYCIGASCITAWPTGGSGTITGVTAGTGLTGGGTSGNVTLNVNKIPLYQCPTGWTPVCPGGGITCTGQIQLGSTCADRQWGNCITLQARGCTLLGNLVQ